MATNHETLYQKAHAAGMAAGDAAMTIEEFVKEAQTFELYDALDQIGDAKAERPSEEMTRRWHIVAAELARRGNLLDYDPPSPMTDQGDIRNSTDWTTQEKYDEGLRHFDNGDRTHAKFYFIGAATRLGVDRDHARTLSAADLKTLIEGKI